MVSFSLHKADASSDEDDKRRAFAAVYRQHVDAVYRYVLIRVGSQADAQDVTAQTFVSALDHFYAYRGEAEIAAWLLGIARHKVADHFRAKGRRAAVSLSDDDRLTDETAAPEETVILRLQIERAAAALNALAPDRAEALRLHVFGGLSIKEAAAVMGKHDSAVKMLISRGLADLRTRLNVSEREES